MRNLKHMLVAGLIVVGLGMSACDLATAKGPNPGDPGTIVGGPIEWMAPQSRGQSTKINKAAVSSARYTAGQISPQRATPMPLPGPRQR